MVIIISVVTSIIAVVVVIIIIVILYSLMSLTNKVSAPPTILSPRPVVPFGISTTHSWPGMIGAVRGFGVEVSDGRTCETGFPY